MAKAPWAILTSDWHLRLGGIVWGDHPDLNGDIEFGLEQVQEHLENYDPPTILLAGDILHVPKLDVNLVVLLNSFFNAYCDRRLILFVQGQHDMSVPTLIDAFCPRAIHIHNKTFNDNGILIRGVDYCRPRKLRDNVNFDVEADILLTHLPWIDTMGEYGIIDLPTNFKLVCSGDYHKNFTYTKRNTTLLSPGPLCMQRITESPIHGVWLIYDDFSFEMLPIKSRGFFEYYIKSEDELEKFYDLWAELPPIILQEGVPATIAKNMVRIVYNPLIKDVRTRLTALASTQVHLFLTPGHNAPVEARTTANTACVMSCGAVLEKLYENHPCLGDAKQLLATNSPKHLETVLAGICERVLSGSG